MTDQEIEKIVKSNMMLTMDFVGIRQDFEQKLKRKPLTDKELNLIGAHWHYNLLGKDDKAELFAFARAIEAAHGIKGEA